jgi:hypothetical protein
MGTIEPFETQDKQDFHRKYVGIGNPVKWVL